MDDRDRRLVDFMVALLGRLGVSDLTQVIAQATAQTTIQGRDPHLTAYARSLVARLLE
jgi:hypothetical protein